MIKEINHTELSALIDNNKLTVVKFGADWCATCNAIHPALEALAINTPHVTFYEMNADKNTEFVVGLGIKSLPTFGFYKNGQLLSLDKSITGKDIMSKIEKYN